MSVVTSVILTSFEDSDKAIAHINEHCGLVLKDAAQEHGGTGGDKYMQIEVYLAAFNHWDPFDFIWAIQSAPWDRPYCVQVFLNGEHSNRVVEVDPWGDPVEVEKRFRNAMSRSD